MKKITLKDIDSLLESEITNMSLKPQTSTQQNDNEKQLNQLSEPLFKYLDTEEEEENNNLEMNGKLKNIFTNPDEKRAKTTQVQNSRNKLQNLQNLRQQITSQLDSIKQKEAEDQKKIQQQFLNIQNQMASTNDDNSIQESGVAAPILQRQFPNQMKDPIKEFSANPAMPSPPQMPNQSGSLPQPRKKTIKVKFESKTQHPFEAEFTERGFKIGNTRLSFETIEDAISKNITLTLDGGSGLVLDAVRMQKILKYKGRT